MSRPLSEPASALGAERFARLLKGFLPLAGKIAVAVSGGPDSMALAFCLKRWGQCAIIALIVDHGLRAEAAAEAAQVKDNFAKLGIEAEILRWHHAPISGRLHEKARAARYSLLTDACRRHSVSDLFTAHHRDDQAETILMRLAKGSGIEGLAGIAAQSQRDDIRLLRPFLPVAKEQLIATCEAEKIPFVTDPSNASTHYARGRLRKVMPLLAGEGFSADNLVALGARAAEVKEALEHSTRAFLHDAGQSEIGGSVRLDRAALHAIPRAIALRALTACLRYVHEEPYPPEYAALSGLLDAILSPEEEITRTLYGCIISIAATRLTFLREPAGATEILTLKPGETLLWDKRWLVTAGPQAPASTLRALGNPPHTEVDALAPFLRRLVAQGRVRAGLPALWQGERLVAIPSFSNSGDFSLRYRKQAFP